MNKPKTSNMNNKLNLFDRLFSLPIYNGELQSPGDDILMKANTILIDISKLLLTLSTGVVGISVSLKKDKTVPHENLLVYGWVLEGFSLIFGILFLYSMVKLYINWNNAELVDRTSTILGLLQFLTFLVGMILMAAATVKS